MNDEIFTGFNFGWLDQVRTKNRGWFVLVGDDSGHHYVVPEEKREEWYKLFESEEVEVPEWAHIVDGRLRFREWENF